MHLVGLFRFWPDVAARVHATRAVPPPAAGGDEGVMLPAVLPLTGSFNLAVLYDAADDGEAGAAAFLGLAHAIGGGQLARAASGAWAVPAPPFPGAASGGSPFGAVPLGIGLQVLRSMDGWNVIAAPNRATWLTVSMTFLRRRLFNRVEAEASWRSADVNELATLVLATHHADDVEGTSGTYEVPALCVRSWLDSAQAASSGGDPFHTPAAELADVLHYGAILRLPPGMTATPDAVAAHIRTLGGLDFALA